MRSNEYRAYTVNKGLPAALWCVPVAPRDLPAHPGRAERETKRDQKRTAPGQAGRVPRARLPATADERGWEQRALVGTKRLAQRIRQSDRGAAAQRVRRDLHPETPFGSLPASPEGSTWPCSSELLEVIEGRSVGQAGMSSGSDTLQCSSSSATLPNGSLKATKRPSAPCCGVSCKKATPRCCKTFIVVARSSVAKTRSTCVSPG